MPLFHENRDRHLGKLGLSPAFVVSEKITHFGDTTLANTINRIDFDGTHPKTVVQTVISPRDVQIYDDHMYYINYQSIGPNQSGPFLFQWVRASLDGTNREVVYQVPRLDGPLDAIQFVVVPELNATILISIGVLIGGFSILARRRRNGH